MPRLSTEDASGPDEDDAIPTATHSAAELPYAQSSAAVLTPALQVTTAQDIISVASSVIELSLTSGGTTEPFSSPSPLNNFSPFPSLRFPLPPPPDPARYPDKATLKQAEREAKRLHKAYDRAINDRTKALQERAKLVAKTTTNTTSHHSKTTNPAKAQPHHLQDGPAPLGKEAPPPCRRHFCTLPPPLLRRRRRRRSLLGAVEDVTAHCGLFDPAAAHYDAMAGDVGARVCGWVQDEASRRVVLRLDGGPGY